MKKKIFFIILSFLLFVLVAETIFTLFFVYRQNYYGPLAKFTLNDKRKIIEFRIPHDKSTGRMLPGEHVYKSNIIKINSAGFRGNEFKKDNVSNCRFIALGGSTTLNLSSQNPWTEILQKKLQDNFNKNCEVINTGLLGASLNDIENLFFSNLKIYKPNYIILLSNHNSAHYDSFAKGHKKPNLLENELSYKIFRIHNYMFSNLMIYRFFDLSYKRVVWIFSSNKEGLLRNPYRKNVYHLPDYFRKNYRLQIENIVLFSKRNNIKVILVKQPRYLELEIYNELKKKNIEELINDFIIYRDFESNKKKDNIEKFNIYSNIILNKNLDLIKDKYNEVKIIDPIKVFINRGKIKQNFLEDKLHYTQSGNYLLAEEIYKKLNDLSMK